MCPFCITTNVVPRSKASSIYDATHKTWIFQVPLRISHNYMNSLSATGIPCILLFKQGYDISSSKAKFKCHATHTNDPDKTKHYISHAILPKRYVEAENASLPPDSQDSNWNAWTDAERGGVIAAAILACLFFFILSYWCASRVKRRKELEVRMEGRVRHRRRRRSHRP
jgi:hypothetical protein